jgi:hypothetical protein
MHYLCKQKRRMEEKKHTDWPENVILIDADYADRTVFELSVQMERMLERRMPKVDLAKWVDFVALDGGLRPGENQTQVLMVYSGDKGELKNFEPHDLKSDLDGRAFSDHLGEFVFASFPVESQVVTRGKLYLQSVEALLAAKEVKRLILIPDVDEYGMDLKAVLRETQQKEVVLLTVNPLTGVHCEQEILTYSLMAALGVKGSELQ